MSLRDFDLRPTFSDSRIKDAANSCARSGLVRITDLFGPDVAEALHDHLDSQIEWSRTVSQAEKALDLAPGLVAAMDRGRGTELMAAVHQAAREGFQFLFDSVLVSDDPATRMARGLLLDRVIQALNHQAVLDSFGAITGEPSIRRVNGQATR